MLRPQITLDARFKKRVQARYERFNVQGGVLVDKPHHEPKPARQVKRERFAAKKERAQRKDVQKAAKPSGAAKKAKKKTLKAKVKAGIKKAKKKLTTKAAKQKAMVAEHRRRGLGTMEGGPIRLQKQKTRGTVAQVGEHLRKTHGIPYLTAPFRRENTPEMKQLRKAFFDLLRRRTRSYSTVESKFRAVLRTPILKKRYGRNSAARIRVKTFDRLAIDTGQFFRSLVAKVRVNKPKG